jgi:hypothetical protein
VKLLYNSSFKTISKYMKYVTFLSGFVSICILLNNSITLANSHELTNGEIHEGLSTLEWQSIKKQIDFKINISNARTGNPKILNNSAIKQTTYLKASYPERSDNFGHSVAISGDTMVVSSIREDSIAAGVNGDETDNTSSDSGAAYVFVKEGESWVKQAYLKSSNPRQGDRFGQSVAIDGDTIVVGANRAHPFLRNSGIAYVFVRNNGVWEQQDFLRASNSGLNDQFGYSVAISNDTIVIGAIFEQSNATGVNGDESDNSVSGAGAAYVFIRESGIWTQQAYLKASSAPDIIDVFGVSVAISGNTIAVGASQESSNSLGINNDQSNNLANQSGAVYVFNRMGTQWSQQAYIKASNTGEEDYFGENIAISGDTLVVSAQFESSNATGIDGDQLNDLSESSGAAYVFIRTAETWSQQAYLKASNAQTNDIFGNSVAIDGDTIVVGALGEDSDAMGLNGNEFDNSSNNSGALYVFNRLDDVWLQSHYVKASNSQANDLFGQSVAVDENTIVSGSIDEDSNGEDEANNQSHNSGAAYVFELDQGFDLQAGHSALWYNPEQSGHGINVYMLADNRIIVLWYVYDDQGNQVWLLGVGTHDGTKATLDVTFNDGAMFPPDFDSADVNTVSWGQFELEFSGCNNGLFKWIPIADNGFTAGETNVTRLTTSSGLTCTDTAAKEALETQVEKSSFKASDFAMQAAHSALWYNPEQSGHGINVYMLDDNRIIVIWYVYDDQGNQVWLLGVGTHDGRNASLDVTVTSGAMFPPNFEAGDVVSENWGQFELEFSGCNNGLFRWLPVAGNGYTSGEINVTRLTSTLGLTCTE